MKLEHVNSLNNRQRERFNRMKASQWESERGALQQQSRALALKAENEHKTVVILVVAFVAFLIAVGAVWVIRMRRHRERENEERIEALQKMVDEFNADSASRAAGMLTIWLPSGVRCSGSWASSRWWRRLRPNRTARCSDEYLLLMARPMEDSLIGKISLR